MCQSDEVLIGAVVLATAACILFVVVSIWSRRVMREAIEMYREAVDAYKLAVDTYPERNTNG